MTAEFDLRALAKINLDLRVLRKRPDNYHEIRTVFQTISLADRIRVSYQPASDVSVAIDGNVDIADNLIARATRLVAHELTCGGVFRFRLTKRIPMGAGLGGGSSDAAAILLGLPALLGRKIPFARLAALAAALGSDVAFFLYGGTAVGLGRGEELYPLPDFPALPGLLVAPAIHVSTPEAYRALSANPAAATPEEKLQAFARFTWTEDLTLAENDFETPVFAQNPELGTARELLASAGAVCARMTGSGSSLFGLFTSRAARDEARRACAAHRTLPFTMVGRKRYRALWARQTEPAPPTFREEPEPSI